MTLSEPGWPDWDFGEFSAHAEVCVSHQNQEDYDAEAASSFTEAKLLQVGLKAGRRGPQI